MRTLHDDITDVPGLRVGNDTNLEAGTGCTVILCDQPMVGGVDIRGGAPATRETDLLNPLCLVEEVHALLLTGGSAFGLDAASGVVHYLTEHNIGLETGVARVPIVPGAAIFDLAFGTATVRPDVEAGYRACQTATHGPLTLGNIGAGTGATVGKSHGPFLAMKGGLGSASTMLPDGIIVGALVIVNALGDVIDPQTQQVLAGSRNPHTASSVTNLGTSNPLGNTTIAAIATNAALNKAETTKLAQMAQAGMAHVIRPVHTMFDGDAIFSLATRKSAEVNHDPGNAGLRVSLLGAAAADTLARAILKAVRSAQPLHGIPAAS